MREHFGKRLKAERPEAWRAGHGRLYEHLRETAKPLPDTLSEMAPLFQAMQHGCQAGRHEAVLHEVFGPRIRRGGENYTIQKLGAYGADLAALAGLFDPPFERPLPTLTEVDQAFILNDSAFDLRALGRLSEAAAPIRASLDAYVAMQNWTGSAVSACNLCELHLTLGDVAEAVATGEASVTYADRSGDGFMRTASRAYLANALHQAGEGARAEELFEEAEALQAEWQPEYQRLYSVQGFFYCDLLLARGSAIEVRQRANSALEFGGEHYWLLGRALDDVSLGSAALALGEHGEARRRLDEGLDGLRQAGQRGYLERGLLARAALFRETKRPQARFGTGDAHR